MSKGLRLSEKWFNRGLWLISFVFAAFLIGLGGTIIGDLPKVEKNYTVEDFIDKTAAQPIKAQLKESERIRNDLYESSSQAQVKLNAASNSYNSAKDTFNNWVATRQATEQASQNDELITRTKALDDLKALQKAATVEVDKIAQNSLNAEQNQRKLQDKLFVLENAAQEKLNVIWHKQEINVFLYRLALTLPLLGIAFWLFKRKRQTKYWPFVWGFIFFALFAFFVELVPYLPSYGGYIRYIVGIILTVVIGRQAILSLNQYLEKQKLAESQPETQRREELSYDTAIARLSKNACPGCERVVDLKDVTNDFCPHCGIGLHDYCVKCNGRKSAFAKFCQRCGNHAVVKSS
jgi:hypothetical protein